MGKETLPTLVETVMATIFEDDPVKKMQAFRENHERNVRRFATMPNKDLAEQAAYYLNQCQRPYPEFPKGSAVYDIVMHDVIIPELLKRVGDAAGPQALTVMCRKLIAHHGESYICKTCQEAEELLKELNTDP